VTIDAAGRLRGDLDDKADVVGCGDIEAHAQPS